LRGAAVVRCCDDVVTDDIDSKALHAEAQNVVGDGGRYVRGLQTRVAIVELTDMTGL
jgi:hypothetical protein